MLFNHSPFLSFNPLLVLMAKRPIVKLLRTPRILRSLIIYLNTHKNILIFFFLSFFSLVNFRFQNFLDFFFFIFKIHSKEYCPFFVALKVAHQFVSIISISVYEYTLLFNLQILNKNILIKFLIKWIYIYLVYFAPAPSTASLSRRSDKYTM